MLLAYFFFLSHFMLLPYFFTSINTPYTIMNKATTTKKDL